MEKLLAALLTLAPSTITLDGQPLSTTVDVYQLVESVEQDVEVEEEDEGEDGSGLQKKVLIGAAIGCLSGLVWLRVVSDASQHASNDNLVACGIVAGYGAGAGLVVGLLVP